MSMTFMGYRYITTSAGYIRVMYFIESGSYTQVSQSSFSNALSAAGISSYDGSVSLARKQGSTIGATGITIGNQVTTLSGTDLYLGSSLIGTIGQYGDTYNLAGMILYRDSDDKYILCSFSSVNEESGGVVLPGAGSWGYYEGPTWAGTVANGYGNYNEELNNFLVSNPPKSVIDPYEPAGTTDTGGAENATYDFTTTDDIAVPSLPSLSAVNTGFISIWIPDNDQILDLSSYMWNADITTIDFWKKLLADPLDLILGLSIMPFTLEASGSDTVTVGLINTNIEMDYYDQQYVELDCGNINVLETWGAYLDYDPYTKVEIYLPYCGTHPLKVDDIMNASVNLTYHVDLLTGSCIAMITCTKNNAPLDSVMYQFSGNCASQVPVTAQQWADAVRSAISIGTSIGSMIASGGATALEGAGAVVENVMNLKPGIERSGAIGSTAGLMAVQKPYLILTRPRQALPETQNAFTGYPSFITESLGDLTGMTYVEEVHLSGIACTDDELSEIESLLKSGVIL